MKVDIFIHLCAKSPVNVRVLIYFIGPERYHLFNRVQYQHRYVKYMGFRLDVVYNVETV